MYEKLYSVWIVMWYRIIVIVLGSNSCFVLLLLFIIYVVFCMIAVGYEYRKFDADYNRNDREKYVIALIIYCYWFVMQVLAIIAK